MVSMLSDSLLLMKSELLETLQLYSVSGILGLCLPSVCHINPQQVTRLLRSLWLMFWLMGLQAAVLSASTV